MNAAGATALLIGFEPFAGECVNPSAEVARRLGGEHIGSCSIVAAILPVVFSTVTEKLTTLLETHRPDIVIALGQAGGRSVISLERVAVNLIDARIPDNDSSQPIDVPVIADAPAAYFSTLPVKAMRAHLDALGIPVALSYSAGTFVCNQVFYALAHWGATHNRAMRGGFIHLPWLPEQASRHRGEPSMALETMIAGIRAATECVLTTPIDLRLRGGATH
ncbi:MAG: pyroglutamyl-peptidase I [Rhodanobacteraceae bacterium]